MKRTGPDQATRDLVYGRDGMACVVCGETYCLQIHHRSGRRMGGTSRPEVNSPANLLLLCEGCHMNVESHRERAIALGLLVRSGHDPALVPVSVGAAVYVLGDDGSRTRVLTDPSDSRRAR